MNEIYICRNCNGLFPLFDTNYCSKCDTPLLVYCQTCYNNKENYNIISDLWECPACNKILCDICIGDEWPCACNCNNSYCYNVDDTELVCEQCFKEGLRICPGYECDKFCNACLNNCPIKNKIEEYVLCEYCKSQLMETVCSF